jgi:hypothetical protein
MIRPDSSRAGPVTGGTATSIAMECTKLGVPLTMMTFTRM